MFRRAKTVLADGFTGLVDGITNGRAEIFLHMGFEPEKHAGEGVVGPRLAKTRSIRLHEGLGGEEVGIDETGEEKAEDEGHPIIARVGTS